MADQELFITGPTDSPKWGPLQSCFSDSERELMHASLNKSICDNCHAMREVAWYCMCCYYKNRWTFLVGNCTLVFGLIICKIKREIDGATCCNYCSENRLRCKRMKLKFLNIVRLEIFSIIFIESNRFF